MFRDKIYAPNYEDFGVLAAVNGCGARADFVNLTGERALNLTPNSARASAANSGFNLARKTETNLTRANLTEQNARVNLSSNLRASETATSETLGFCQNASQIYAKDKFAETSVNLTANEL